MLRTNYGAHRKESFCVVGQLREDFQGTDEEFRNKLKQMVEAIRDGQSSEEFGSLD